MSEAHLLMTGFKDHATPQMRFSAAPRLTVRQAFYEAAERMPAGASIVFHRTCKTVAVDLYPFATPEQALADTGPEPSHLSYTFYPAHQSVLIGRIKAERQRSGIGSAMIASQYPFWQKMGVRMLSVSTHAMGEGFYHKLGFRDVARLPEKPREDPRYSTFLRLDLCDSAQKSTFEKAMGRALPFAPFPLAASTLAL